MRKKMLIAAGVVGLLVVAAGVVLWQVMAAPLYTPGMVRAGTNLRAPLDPPAQAGDGYWLVEDDVRLFHSTQGQGRPVLVVHGGPGYPLRGPLAGLDPLAGDCTFYFYDQRGCGKSTRPFDRFEASSFYANMTELERTLGIGAQVADIERIRRILGRDKLTVMGHSFGAFLAAMYATEFPERVEALVLVAPAGVLVLPDEGDGLFETIRQRLPADRRAEYDQFLGEYLDFGSVFARSEAELAGMNRRLGAYFLAGAGGPGEADMPDDNGGWMVQALYFSMGKRHDYRPALKQVQAPALVIHGEGDLAPERVSRMYAECLPNSRLHVLKGERSAAGHFPFSTQPEAFAKVVGEFLAATR